MGAQHPLSHPPILFVYVFVFIQIVLCFCVVVYCAVSVIIYFPRSVLLYVAAVFTRSVASRSVFRTRLCRYFGLSAYIYAFSRFFI